MGYAFDLVVHHWITHLGSYQFHYRHRFLAWWEFRPRESRITNYLRPYVVSFRGISAKEEHIGGVPFTFESICHHGLYKRPDEFVTR